MSWIKNAALVALAILGMSVLASAQQQMLLPYNNPIFQSTWENPAVRPWFRYSIGLPVLSSVELGLVNNGFLLADVTKEENGILHLKPELLGKELEKNPYSLFYNEAQIDLLHFRMQWRDYFFWIAARNVTQQSYTLTSDVARLGIVGNEPFVGKTVDFNDLGLNLVNYHELSLGFSKMLDNLTFGFRASLLTGQLSMHYAARDATLTISDDVRGGLYAHKFKMDAQLNTSGVPKGNDGKPDFGNIANMRYVNFSNPGFALGGGVSWMPEENTELSFSFSDVGMIAWGGDLATYQPRNLEYEYRGISGVAKILHDRNLNWDLLDTVSTNAVKNAFKLNEEKEKAGDAYTTWLSPKVHLMGTYRLARATKAGLSFSATYHQGHFYPSATMSVTQGFSDIFFAQLAVSYNQRSFLNVGSSLVFNPGPVQFYVVTDNLLGLIKPTIMKATNIRLGMNIILGPRYKNTTLTHR